MALIKCSECGKEISTTAETCPHCGSKTSHGQSVAEAKGYLVWWVLAFVMLFSGILMMATNMETYFDRIDSLEYYDYFSDSTQESIQHFGIGLLLFISGIGDMCIIGYKMKQMKESGVNAYLTKENRWDSPDLEWECSRCYSINQPGVTNCTRCGAARGGVRGISAESVPTWKRIQMEEEKQRMDLNAARDSKCIFCGEAMNAGQLFCGACGRRKD